MKRGKFIIFFLVVIMVFTQSGCVIKPNGNGGKETTKPKGVNKDEFNMVTLKTENGKTFELALGMTQNEVGDSFLPYYEDEPEDTWVDEAWGFGNSGFSVNFNVNNTERGQAALLSILEVYATPTPQGLSQGNSAEKVKELYGEPDDIFSRNYTNKQVFWWEYDVGDYYFYVVLNDDDTVFNWAISTYSQGPLMEIDYDAEKTPDKVKLTFNNGTELNLHVGMTEKEFIKLINEKRVGYFTKPINEVIRSEESDVGQYVPDFGYYIVRHVGAAYFGGIQCIVNFSEDLSTDISNVITQIEV